MITILTYIALISGGILVLLLLLSLLSGLDLDLDLHLDGDVDVDGGGGLGAVKGALTFFSIGSWVARLFIISQLDPVVAFTLGAAAGAVGVYILSLILKFLLSQQANVNWSVEDALMEEGTVYLRIPADGQGIVNVTVKGTKRELKARAKGGQDIPTGAPVRVEDLHADGTVIVSPMDSKDGK
ncbi:MAG: hypothetical protein AAF597_19255 [Bacteroidota bacterium]